MVKDQRAQMTLSPDARTHSYVDSEQQDEINSLMTLAFQPSLIGAALDAAAKGPSVGPPPDSSFVARLQDTIMSYKYMILDIPETLYRKLHGVPPPTDEEERIARVAGDIEFIPVPESNLVELAYRSRSPRWAARLVNLLTS
jgi:hypothetical protein